MALSDFISDKPMQTVASMAIGATLLLTTANARAEPPHLASHWLPTPLTMQECLQRSFAALCELGFQDAHLGKSGDVVFGSRDDSHMEVICAIPDWAVFVGASPSLEQVAKYRDELVKRFSSAQDLNQNAARSSLQCPASAPPPGR
jgi:hypothetical protein